MNWNDSHMYNFYAGQVYNSASIGLYSEDDWSSDRYKSMDSTQTLLSDYFNGQTKKMNYLYDFGDDWLHIITVLKKPKEEVLYPKCIKAENSAPIDDCGGIPGFYHLLEILEKKRKTAEEKEMLEWYGIPKGKTYEEVYGTELEELNQRLLTVFRE